MRRKRMTNKEIAIKWYKKLEFPAEMDAEFYALCERCEIPDGLTIDDVNITGEQGEELGLQTLYFLENMLNASEGARNELPSAA